MVFFWRYYVFRIFTECTVCVLDCKGLAELKWKPTLGHFFMRVTHDKGILLRLYTQNIDGLDYLTGLGGESICNVHGSIAEASCEFCGDKSYSSDEFVQAVKTNIKV